MVRKSLKPKRLLTVPEVIHPLLQAPAEAGLLLAFPSLPCSPVGQVNVSRDDVGLKSRPHLLCRRWDPFGQKTPEASGDSGTATISLSH